MTKKKRRKLKVGNILIALTLLILLVLALIYLFKIIKNDDDSFSGIDFNSLLENGVGEDEEKVYTASVITAGDNLIHSSLYHDANKNANYNGYDFSPMYELLQPIVSEYDLAYYNQETILGGSELGLKDYPTFNSPYEVGDAMVDLGFNLVSLATNHTIDSGTQAVLNSREYWDSQSGVIAVGSYSSNEERDEVVIGEVNNITYSMLNYTYGTNGIRVPSGKEYLVNVWPTDIDNINNPEKDKKYQEYKEQVKEDIESVRDKVDVLMVAMHWGVEYTHEPTKYEEDMALYLASLGVDVIIGTHPHVVQPIEYIDDTLVIYSLGNLISAQYQNKGTCTNYKCMVGLMSAFEITKTVKGDEVDIKVESTSNELIYTYYNQSTWRNFKVVPFSSPEIVNYLPNYKKVYDTYREVIVDRDESIVVVDAYE